MTRFTIVLLLLSSGFSTPLKAVEKPSLNIKLQSDLISPGVTIPGIQASICQISLDVSINKEGTGNGKLTLNPNSTQFDVIGDLSATGMLSFIKLDCTLKFVKEVDFIREVGLPPEYWSIHQLSCPKISTTCFLVTEHRGPRDRFFGHDRFIPDSGRFLISDSDGKTRFRIDVRKPDEVTDPLPCHPGCFPAGTPVLTPQGTRRIETILIGDKVTTVNSNGTTSSGEVKSIFITDNRFIEVETEQGRLLTTHTQPLALYAGGLKPAGDLKVGDVIASWMDNHRHPATVRMVIDKREAGKVYNLVVGDMEIFVANGFLARSKPPAVESDRK